MVDSYEFICLYYAFKSILILSFFLNMHIFPQYYIIMPEQGTKMNRYNTKPRFLGGFHGGRRDCRVFSKRTWWNEATRIGI